MGDGSECEDMMMNSPDRCGGSISSDGGLLETQPMVVGATMGLSVKCARDWCGQFYQECWCRECILIGWAWKPMLQAPMVVRLLTIKPSLEKHQFQPHRRHAATMSFHSVSLTEDKKIEGMLSLKRVRASFHEWPGVGFLCLVNTILF
nr:hypothetical protein [Tanacetum cinerariifolium]